MTFILRKLIGSVDCFSVGRIHQTAALPKSALHPFFRGRLDMAVIQPSLFFLFDRFPEKKENIKTLFEENESFKTLCEDYHQCAEALRFWNQSSSEDAPARVREYRALLQELEEEILKNVNEST
jgi:hypothetical protein